MGLYMHFHLRPGFSMLVRDDFAFQFYVLHVTVSQTLLGTESDVKESESQVTVHR